MQIMEYNFNIEFLKGEENVAADHFSRLCDRVMSLTFNPIVAPLSFEVKHKLKGVHNSLAGHNGVEKTIEKLTAQGVAPWPAWRDDIKQFIASCPICQKLDQRSIKIHTEPFTTSTREPMQTLNIDSIGPLPADQYGNTFILVVIDCFTRFVELYAVRDVGAVEAARALLQQVGRYGAPQFIRSDRGSQFVNETIEQLLKLVGTEHQLTLAYSKEENAIVERANKEVMRHLRAILLDKNTTNDWVTYLPFVQRIMNASEHSSIGMSPAQLLFGNAVTLDKGIFLPHKYGYNPTSEEDVPLSEWASKMVSKQAELIRLAREHQAQSDDQKIVEADPRRTEFPINSYVLVQYRVRPPTKFHTAWKGPMRVVDFRKSSYSVQDLVTSKIHTYHVTQLKAFKYDEMEVDPAQLARAEQQEFLVENILEHRGDTNSRLDYEFLVQWVGYEDPSWESWTDVKDNEELIKYLYTHQLKKFLTAQQKVEAQQLLVQA